MLINKSNYEAFALDYIEGNLSGADLKAMRAFLQAHPDIDTEIAQLSADFIELTPNDGITYHATTDLLKEEGAVVVPFYRRAIYKWAAAASVALLIGFGVGYFAAHRSLQTSGAVATTTTVETPKEEVQPTIETTVTPTEEGAILEEEEEGAVIKKEAQVFDNQQFATTTSTKEVEKKNTIEVAIEKVEEAIIPQQEAIAEVAPDAVEEKENIIPENTPLPIEEATTSTEVVATTMIDALPELPEAPLTTIPTLKEDTIVIVLSKERMAMSNNNDGNILRRFGRLRQFMGKLPFDDVNLQSFVPTYFIDADTETNGE
ncbi:MAG: hypothetical protein AAGI23_21085 [Bacteroidota bacterium]